MSTIIQESFLKLKEYCEKEEFKGWDPYDGLNSRIFQGLPIVNKKRIFRLLWIQFFKRSPINLRRLTFIPKGLNPKGLALFLSSYCNLYKTNKNNDYLKKINELGWKLISLKSKGYSGSCWGYNFDWQAKAFFQPSYTPTVVASTFVGYALLDAFEITNANEFKENALSISSFILNDLNKTYDSDGDFAFSYSPKDKTQVFNASLLASRMLSRLYHYTGNNQYLEAAKKSVSYCCKHQKPDGSWTYSTLPYHQWVDNFHTGYNLECIAEYTKFSGDHTFFENLEKGFKYYINSFFTENGIPKYYNNSVYPIDIHAPAQLIITLNNLNKLEEYLKTADKVLKWTINHMQNKKGYFYYQKNKFITSKIPYMRWSQAWMFYALSSYLTAMKIKT